MLKLNNLLLFHSSGCTHHIAFAGKDVNSCNAWSANTRRWFDVVLTSFERYGRQMDVETTLCAYWVSNYGLCAFRFLYKSIGIEKYIN